MRELFKKHFALTDKGAKDLQKASAASFFAYVINFFPIFELIQNAVTTCLIQRFHDLRSLSVWVRQTDILVNTDAKQTDILEHKGDIAD